MLNWSKKFKLPLPVYFRDGMLYMKGNVVLFHNMLSDDNMLKRIHSAGKKATLLNYTMSYKNGVPSIQKVDPISPDKLKDIELRFPGLFPSINIAPKSSLKTSYIPVKQLLEVDIQQPGSSTETEKKKETVIEKIKSASASLPGITSPEILPDGSGKKPATYDLRNIKVDPALKTKVLITGVSIAAGVFLFSRFAKKRK